MSWLIRQLINFGQIASETVVIETVADDEFIRDANADVIDLDVFLIRFGFEKQRGDLEMLDVLFFEQRLEFLDRISGIDDVFDDDDASAGQVLVEAYELLDFVCGFGSFVRRHFDEAHFTRMAVMFHEIGNDHEGTV